jgi:hypothetical protein
MSTWGQPRLAIEYHGMNKIIISTNELTWKTNVFQGRTLGGGKIIQKL